MGKKAKSKRCVFRYFLKVATEMTEWTDSGRLFERDLSLFDLSEREEVDPACME